MGNKFEIWGWERQERTEWQINHGVPEYHYKEIWRGENFEEAINELNKHRGKYGCLKLECRE